VRREWEHGRNLVVFEVEHGWVGVEVAWWEGERPGAAVLTGWKAHRGKTIRLLRGAIRIREARFCVGWDPRERGALVMTSSKLTTANQRPENPLRRASGELLYRSYRFASPM
jgi:hypothetical protein